MLRSIFLLRRRTCMKLKEIVTRRKLSTAFATESFHKQALKYLNSAPKLQKPFPKSSEPYVSEEYINNLLGKTEKALANIYNDFKDLENKKDIVLLNKTLEVLDTKCFSIVHLLNPNQIFELLCKFYQFYPEQMHTIYFYEKAISNLVTSAENGLLNDQELVQLLFYMGMNKDVARSYIHDIRIFLTDIKHLTLFEKCIVADCFVKSGVKFTPDETQLYEQTLEDEFENLTENTASLIIICKALTLISTGEVLTLRKLSETVCSAKEPWSFKVIANLLTLYSRALLFEPKVIDYLVKDGIEILKKDLETGNMSLELDDIDKFLRSISNLGLTMNLDEKLVLRTIVENRFNEYRQQINLTYFINAVLCLHILRCWSTKLLIKSFNGRVFEPVFQMKHFQRLKPRLILLLSQIRLEMKMEIPKSLMKTMSFQYSATENTETVRDICQNLIERKLVNSVNIECPIEALPIAGVTLRSKNNNKVYHVDVLDNTSCLKDTYIPHGYMNLKLRLLTRLRYQQILVQKNLLEKPQGAERYIVSRINFGRAVKFHQQW